MPRRDDPSDLPPTVTPPELNPLINPLLAQNMGRWAEVYFTAAPEKREEAVLELLRELGGEASQHPQDSTAQPATSGEQVSSTPSSDSDPKADSELPLGCRSCGYENRPGQNYCGMCGTRLGDASSQPEPAPSQKEPGTQFLPPERAPDDWPAQEPAVEVSTSSSVHEEREADSRDDNLDHMFETAPPSFFYSYRAVIGGALAIAIALVAYTAWRSGQTASGLSQAAPQAPVVTEQATPTQSPSAPNTDAANRKSVAATEPAVPSESTPKPIASARPGRGEPNETPGTPIPAEKPPQAQPGQGNGAEELAIARGYLDSASGHPRDTSAATEWLWKAVAKQNTDATVLLSDLYLRGDGVSKNCDQARVLLDAAARKGRKDAGERLRHMQAFGCE